VLVHLASNVLVPSLRNIGAAGAIIVAVVVGFKLGAALEPPAPGQPVPGSGTLGSGTMAQTTMLQSVIIPLGLSYYSFRCLHFLIERYKGRIERMPFRDLAAYLFFLPTFLVGPIHRFEAFHADARRQRFDPALLSLGLERIIQGYAKIVILGYFCTGQLLGNHIASQPDPGAAWTIYLGIVQNGLNLYFQFSGYADVAIGFSLMLGFRIMENFNWPYLQPNISAFWQSWHRSLSLWCREYIYGVVVANSRSPALGVLTTMVVIGLWHEISLRFVLWGAYHGIGLIVWQRFQDWKMARGITAPPALALPIHVASVLLTVHFVWFGFVILTAPSAADALTLFMRLGRGI
jgi:alginate O-acetyltransferase complex protein AlgI